MKRLLVACCVLSGCMVGPDYERPSLPESDRNSIALTPDIEVGEADPEWWNAFDDPTLTQLIEDSLARNNQIEAARARLIEARARLSEVARVRLPVGELSGSGARQQQSAFAFGGEGSLPSLTLYSVNLDVGWELDFFGRVRRSVAASRAGAAAAQARLADVQVLIAAETGSAYAALRGAQVRLEVAKRNAENQSSTLDLTQTLLDGGRGTGLDVARASSQLQATLASIPPLETLVRTELYRLGVLTGRFPDALADDLLPAAALPLVPDQLTVILPSELLARRPDLRAAEWDLVSATQQIGVATAELYPRFDLFGQVGRTALTLGGLDGSEAETYRYGLSAFWPALDLTRVRARIDQADARGVAALNAFEEAYLQAQAEAQTALVRFINERKRRDYLAIAVQETETAVRLARQRFEAGVDNFLQVLDAERRLLETEDQLAVSDTNVITALIALYKAMGGGWSE